MLVQISPWDPKTFSYMLEILFPIICLPFCFDFVHYCVGELSRIIIQERVHRM